MTFAATRCIFWALSGSKMHLRHWGSLQHSRKPSSWWEGGSLPLPKKPFLGVGLWPQISALQVSWVSPKNSWLHSWVQWATKIAARGSASNKQLKNTDVYVCCDFRCQGVYLQSVSSGDSSLFSAAASHTASLSSLLSLSSWVLCVLSFKDSKCF